MPPKPVAQRTVSSKKSSPSLPPAGSSSNSNSNAGVENSKATTVSTSSSGTSTPVASRPVVAAAGKASRPGAYEPNSISTKSSSKGRVLQRDLPTIKPTSSGFSLKRLAVRITLLYAFVAYFFICPNDPSRAPAVCQSFSNLQSYRHQAIRHATPYVEPYISQARSAITPYTEPYLAATKPYYSKAQGFLAPQLNKVEAAYQKLVKPNVLRALSHSHARVAPHYNRLSKGYSRVVDPYLARYNALATELYDINVKPQVDSANYAFQKTVKPVYDGTWSAYRKAHPIARHHWSNTIYPFASKSYDTSRRTYGTHVHPRLLTSWSYIVSFLSENIGPQIRRFHSKYISPQLSKIEDRAFTYKQKKVAEEKVTEMHEELGKADINDEIDELVASIKAEVTPLPATTSPAADSTVTVHPSAKKDEIAEAVEKEEAERALTVEKRRTIEALHDLYEIEIPKLTDTELTLLADRLTVLRKGALRDIPARFEISVKSYAQECEKWIGRLEKYWEKANRDERTAVEDKVADGGLIARKASVKLGDRAEEIEDEVDAYLRTHTVREVASAEKAFKTVQNHVGKAQEELGNGYAWLSDVTAKDWKRFHQLAALEGNAHYQLFGLRNGSISHPALDRSLDIEVVLQQIKRQISTLYADAETRLTLAHSVGEKRVKGEFIGIRDAAGKVGAGAAAAAAVLNARAASGYQQASSSVLSVVGATPSPSNAAESASSLAAAASASLSSAYEDSRNSASSVISGAPAAYSSVSASAVSAASDAYATAQSVLAGDYLSDASSLVGDASQAILNAAGIQPSPTNVYQSAQSLAGAAGTVLGDASQAALEGVGLAPSPTDAYQTFTSVVAIATESVGALASDLSANGAAIYSEASAQGASLASEVSASVEDALSTISSAILPSNIESALAEATAALQHAFGEASQTLYRLAGATPSPTSYPQSAQVLLAQASQNLFGLQGSAAALLSSYASEASKSAYSLAGFQTQPTDLPGTISSAASVAQASAASYGNELTEQISSAALNAREAMNKLAAEALAALPSIEALALADISQTLSSQVHEATRSVISVAGGSVTPEGFSEHAASASSRAASVLSSLTAPAPVPAASAVSSSIESVYSQAASAVSSLTSSASLPGASAVSSSIGSAYSHAASVADSLTASAIPSVYSDLSSSAHGATRAAARAVGATASPEGVQEHVESFASSVSSAAASVSASVRARAEL